MTATIKELAYVGVEVEAHDVLAGTHRLRVYSCGNPCDQVVLFVHGSGPGVSAPSHWAHLLPAFAEAGYFAIAPDVLAFGDSEHPDPAPAGGMVEYVDLRARSLVALLDTLGVGKAHFVGNSMGGMITLRVAQIAPDRIDKMVLTGSGGAPLAPGDPAQPPVKYTEEDLAAITHEALVVHGREDRMLPLRAGYHLAEHLPNAQLHVLPHAGHWIQIEQAERFTALAVLFFGER